MDYETVDMNMPDNNGTMPPMMMMQMTFYWSNTVTILFEDWATSTNLGYVFSCVALFFFAMFYEALARMKQKWDQSNLHSDEPSYWRRTFDSRRVISAIIYTIQVGLSYLLMLAIMTYNGGIFISIIVGYAVGYFFFKSTPDQFSAGYQPI